MMTRRKEKRLSSDEWGTLARLAFPGYVMEYQGGGAMDTIPLPSAPTRIIRDAAQAVKRVAGRAIQQVTAGTLTQLLGQPGLVVTAYALEQQGDGDVLHLFCQHRHEVAMCSRCDELSVRVHEQEERCVGQADVGPFFGSTVRVCPLSEAFHRGTGVDRRETSADARL
jgi:hypothetical protein